MILICSRTILPSRRTYRISGDFIIVVITFIIIFIQIFIRNIIHNGVIQKKTRRNKLQILLQLGPHPARIFGRRCGIQEDAEQRNRIWPDERRGWGHAKLLLKFKYILNIQNTRKILTNIAYAHLKCYQTIEKKIHYSKVRSADQSRMPDSPNLLKYAGTQLRERTSRRCGSPRRDSRTNMCSLLQMWVRSITKDYKLGMGIPPVVKRLGDRKIARLCEWKS